MPQVIDGSVELLARIKGRKPMTRWGIGPAATYLRQIGPALAARHFNVAPEAWDSALKEAEARCVYCDPGMVVGGALDAAETEYLWTPVRMPDGRLEHAIVQRAASGRKPTAGACMEFDGIITSARQDRDGDILDPAGAAVDPKCPLLWQHQPWDPIGKLVAIGDAGGEFVKGRFAIVDTELGRDAAKLVEFGALRLSHGFLPLEWDELQTKGQWSGWHVHKYEVMEVSLVSIPSNVDAVITAYSGAKLFHPLVKSWAKGLFDTRRKVHKSAAVGIGNSAGIVEKIASERAVAWAKANADLVIPVSTLEKLCPRCAAHAKAMGWSGVKVGAIKAMPPQMMEGLCDSLGPDEGFFTRCTDHDFGEFEPDDKEAFCAFLHNECVGKWPGEGRGEEAAEPPETKQGRILSGRNQVRIQHARDNLQSIADRTELPREVTALARDAARELDVVLESAKPAENVQAETAEADRIVLKRLREATEKTLRLFDEVIRDRLTDADRVRILGDLERAFVG